MSRRRIFFLLLLASLVLGAGQNLAASDLIDAPKDGASATITQPHATAELIPAKTTIESGQDFDVAVHLHADPDWHTYWINPGDAGLATTIKWTLPPGFVAGPIQWPTPELHNMGPLVTYGYGGDVYLLTTITPPKTDLDPHPLIKAHVEWLVCKEECIPGKADLEITVDSNPLNLRLPADNHELFGQARARLPVANTRWGVTGAYTSNSFILQAIEATTIANPNPLPNLRFFPEQPNVLSNLEADQGKPVRPNDLKHGSTITIALQQNGEKPAQLSGILVSDVPLIGTSKSVYVSSFPVSSQVAAAVPRGGQPLPQPPMDKGVIAPAAVSPQNNGPPLGTAAATTARPFLLAVLGAAFLGGLILNLMPCVLPVLSLKVFSLVRHAGENPRAAWVQGVAFTGGVVISFWILAGLLIALRAFGHQLGWGFQMQSPGFVLALTFLFFFLALNLFGIFEFGSSLVGLDAKATGKLHGTASSFANGALATLAATPCTAPFMGSSLGFAAQQPPFVALLIFTFLGLGMATPYLLLTLFPAAFRFVPKPGAWMEIFKHAMGFLLLATVIFLIYVFGALTRPDQIPALLGALLLGAVAAFLYGRWPLAHGAARMAFLFLALLFLFLALAWGIKLARTPPAPALGESANAEWHPWSPDVVNQALARNQPVFVDFTAAWCLSCKVNEQVALETSSVQQAFQKKNVLLLRGDWTHSDPAISNVLRQYNRDGVPLYLLYSPALKDAPQVLPEVLTPDLVLDAVEKL